MATDLADSKLMITRRAVIRNTATAYRRGPNKVKVPAFVCANECIIGHFVMKRRSVNILRTQACFIVVWSLAAHSGFDANAWI